MDKRSDLMHTKQCERCQKEMEREHFILGSESPDKKSLYRDWCNACGRIEYGSLDGDQEAFAA